MSASRRRVLLYRVVPAASVLLFLGLLAPAVRGAVPDTDHWWILPTFSHYVEGQSASEIASFLLNHSPKYFRPPLLKGLILFVDGFLGLPFRAFPAAGLLIHLLNAVLLALLCRKMGISLRAAISSGVIFLALFIHFHGYLWLPASQHPYSITTTLAVLWLFLRTEELRRRGRPWKGTYALTALGTAVGSLQHSGMIALGSMVCHAWVAPGLSGIQRRELCRRWLPVWGLFLIYPLWAMAAFGDNTAISAIEKIPLPPLAKTAALLLAAAAGLLLIRFAAGMRSLRRGWVGLALALGVWILLMARDLRQVLLPYNGLVPFMTVLGSFLDPIHSALRMDSVDPYHYAQPQVSVFLLLLTLVTAGTFTLAFARRKRGLAVWGVWYGIALAYLLLHKHVASSMPFRTQSRYFLYLSPLFSVMAGCGLAYAAAVLARGARWKRRGRDAALALTLAALCVPNLLAIRLALFRGRLVNTYFVYDDVRAAALIASDLKGAGDGEPVAVEGLTSFWFRKKWSRPVEGERIAFDNFRRILRDRIGRSHPLELAGEARWGKGRGYRIGGGQVFAPDGRPLDLFREEVRVGLALLQEGRREEARRRFLAGAARRPFLVNYVLGERGRLSDAEWITGGLDLRDWAEWMGRRYRRWSIAPAEKWEAVSSLIRAELSDYLLCLSVLAFLEDQGGRPEEAKRWLCQVYLLERDPERAAELLRGDPRAGESILLQEFSARFLDPEWFHNPAPWRRNDYAFARFLARALFGLDLRSGWDRRAGAA